MKLVIDRSRWLRGEGSNNSFLLRSRDDRRCCLGFLGEACGIPEKDLAGKPSPAATMIQHFSKWPEPVLKTSHNFWDPHTQWTERAMKLNDVPGWDERERCLIEHFATIGIELEFVDGPEGT